MKFAADSDHSGSTFNDDRLHAAIWLRNMIVPTEVQRHQRDLERQIDDLASHARAVENELELLRLGRHSGSSRAVNAQVCCPPLRAPLIQEGQITSTAVIALLDPPSMGVRYQEHEDSLKLLPDSALELGTPASSDLLEPLSERDPSGWFQVIVSFRRGICRIQITSFGGRRWKKVSNLREILEDTHRCRFYQKGPDTRGRQAQARWKCMWIAELVPPFRAQNWHEDLARGEEEKPSLSILPNTADLVTIQPQQIWLDQPCFARVEFVTHSPRGHPAHDLLHR